MGPPPAYIFVVRHGTRLDSADKKWHLTSPTPYDPPLTYGGWLQSKALGARIGYILRQAEAGQDVETTVGERDPPEQQEVEVQPKRKRRFNVVLHSSPFLRCIQTAIAISAGVAQVLPSRPAAASPPSYDQSPKSGSPALSVETGTAARAEALSLPPAAQASNEKADEAKRKTTLRLDAFLGEWLSPDYYESITPPPSSVLMLKGAKAELLRREDHAGYFAPLHHSNSFSGQLWSGSPMSAPADPSGFSDSNLDVSALENVTALESSLPEQDATDSTPPTVEPSHRVRFASIVDQEVLGYVAPTPHYAVSLSAKIPEGYVSHAKDACVNLDYQWDSMKAPLEWGDGGAFGEEWAAMHWRFRKGIQCLVDWYSTTDKPISPVSPTGKAQPHASRSDSACSLDEADEEDVETVIIIVSHGAGCNALIGAITHQPALLDVGIASLTMAVRKPEKRPETPLEATPGEPTDNVVVHEGKIPVHQFYDLKIYANTEHLRPAGLAVVQRAQSTPGTSTSSDRGRMPNFVSSSTGNTSITTLGMSPASGPFTYTDSFNRTESRGNSANAALGSMRRPSHNSFTAPRAPSLSTPSFTSSGLSRSPSIGLWTPAASRLNQSQSHEREDEDLDDMFPDFDHQKKLAPVRRNTNDSIGSVPGTDTILETEPFTTVSPVQIPGTSETEAVDDIVAASEVEGALGARKLWGTHGNSGSAERLRALNSSKRRWTVNERA